MANVIFSQKKFTGGLANYIKEDFIPDAFFYAQSLDYRTDPNALTLLPASLKESGGVVTGLLKWADTVPADLSVYAYDNVGSIYKRTNAGSWSNLHMAATSHGNGLQYFYGDDYLYYATDNTLGRYGPLAGSPQFSDDFLKAQGGVPTNTASLSLASASSMYADAADSASLHQTGDITLETYFKATTLPAIGSSMTLLGKWDESGATRSYKLDLFGVSGYFGTGADGSLTISVNTTEAPTDSACTGTAGTTSLSATNASFAANQVIFIHQTRGTGAGGWERNTIAGYTAGTITLTTPLVNTYTSPAQVRVLNQYTNVTVNTGVTYTAKAWNGIVGGILAFLASGTITVTGNISANAVGFRGGTTQGSSTSGGYQGEGTTGAGIVSTAANGNGGGGGFNDSGFGDGGGNGSSGGDGIGTAGAIPGSASGSNDLTTMTFGGGGGSGGVGGNPPGGAAGIGGGIVFLTGTTLTVTGTMIANGSNGTDATDHGCGGGGAGGSILLKAQVATLGTNLINANGGLGGVVGGGDTRKGGDGGSGRIHLDYLTSYTGTTTPTLNATQDNTLVTTATIQARLGISNDGTAFEYLTKSLSTLTTGTWNRLSVSWVASTSTATFYLNAVSLGTSVGTKTSISSNASLLYVGANKTSVIANFFNGLLNDMRIWGNAQTAGQILANNQIQLTGNEGGLEAYYTFNSVYTDKTANANTLTPVNSPTFVTDVPFPAPTTRLDIDQSFVTTGADYDLLTTISEASVDKLTFTPGVDPQKSIDFNINAKGTGDWTVTIHDLQNNVIATQTITNPNLASTGYQEFIFSSPWRIIINKTYHAHLTSTVNDGSVKSSADDDFSTGDFHTYFGFLINDTQFHPIVRMLNKLVIGNERYLATWDGVTYNANAIVFPPLTHVRSFGFWRDYLVVGTWSEVTSGTPNIYDWDQGFLYFWDGISLTFNFLIEVPEGQVNAMYGQDSNLYFVAGYRSDLMIYNGGYILESGGSSSTKIKRLPLLAVGDNLDVYPGAMAMWRSILYYGVAANSNSTTISRGVYSYGTNDPVVVPSLSLDYPISTGNIGNTVKIGLVYPIGQTLLIGWQDGMAFGCDQVNFNNAPASYGTFATLLWDNNQVWHQKSAYRVRIDSLPLRTGESVLAKFKIDRASTWTSNNSITDITNTVTTEDMQNGRGREFQFGFDINQTNGTSPTIIGISALLDDLATEQQL